MTRHETVNPQGDGSGRIFVGNSFGDIYALQENDPSSSYLFIDISDRTG